MPWDSRTGNDGKISREEAIEKITDKAINELGLDRWKVTYEDKVVEDPDDLPDRVDFSKVKIAPVMNQA